MALDIAALRAKAKASAARVMADPELVTPALTGGGGGAIATINKPEEVVNDVEPVSSNLCPVDTSISSSDGNTNSAVVVPVLDSSNNSSSVSLSDSVELTPQQYQVVEKIERIRQLLLSGDPMIETLLTQIRKAIGKDPELVHFLKPEQIGAIVKGCMVMTKVVVVTAAVKKTKTVSGKKLTQLTLDDI